MLYANGYPVGGGGGSDTGGHTIIDENGNSMTARAGLQFVGGANVSDDSTNNKTIVDLASAGGIDGVFIDTDNIIQATTQMSNPFTYTATQDCIVTFIVTSRSGDISVKVDNTMVAYYSSNYIFGYSVLLKKGQTLLGDSGQNYSGTYTVYGIQTGTTHSKFQPVIYSLEEREIGVWTDGKPLYQKTLSIPTSSQNTTYDVSSLNIDTCVKIDAFMSGNGSVPDGYWYSSSNYVSVNYYDGDLFINAPTQYSNNSPCIVTLQYTKSTDTAGSGSWTPQGVPTHHYSTDEHIIGTWIDGSTLYEKTIDFGTLPNASIKSVNTNVSNIGLVTKVNGFAYSSGATINIPYIEASNTSSKQTIDIWHNKSTNKVDINTNFDASGFYGYVVIQYTKLS